jgi:hypothetical protein
MNQIIFLNKFNLKLSFYLIFIERNITKLEYVFLNAHIIGFCTCRFTCFGINGLLSGITYYVNLRILVISILLGVSYLNLRTTYQDYRTTYFSFNSPRYLVLLYFRTTNNELSYNVFFTQFSF